MQTAYSSNIPNWPALWHCCLLVPWYCGTEVESDQQGWSLGLHVSILRRSWNRIVIVSVSSWTKFQMSRFSSSKVWFTNITCVPRSGMVVAFFFFAICGVQCIYSDVQHTGHARSVYNWNCTVCNTEEFIWNKCDMLSTCLIHGWQWRMPSLHGMLWIRVSCVRRQSTILALTCVRQSAFKRIPTHWLLR